MQHMLRIDLHAFGRAEKCRCERNVLDIPAAQFELPRDAAVQPDARRIRSRVAFRLAKT